MDFARLFSGNLTSGGGGGDPGDPIGQSLRFRSDSSRFLRSNSPTSSEISTWNYSVWLKVEGTAGSTTGWKPTVFADAPIGGNPQNATQIRFDTYNATGRNWVFDVYGPRS